MNEELVDVARDKAEGELELLLQDFQTEVQVVEGRIAAP